MNQTKTDYNDRNDIPYQQSEVFTPAPYVPKRRAKYGCCASWFNCGVNRRIVSLEDEIDQKDFNINELEN